MFLEILMVAMALSPGPQVPATDTAQTTRRRLEAPEVIGGVSCDRTPYAHVYRSGAVASCPLAHDTTIGSHKFPRGTWVQLAPDGRLTSVWLPRDWSVQGHTCRGTGNRGWSVTFHPTGTLAFCYLAGVESIDGVPCQRGTFWMEIWRFARRTAPLGVSFHPDGSLAQCQAARDFSLAGISYRKGEIVRTP
jgi:hypothetical protein